MAISVIGVEAEGDLSDDNSETPAVTPHTDTEDGDFLIAVIGLRRTTTSVTGVPSGWTVHSQLNGMISGTSIRSWVYYKTATGSEGAQQFTFDALSRCSLTIMTLRGVLTSDPFNTDMVTHASGGSSEISFAFPSVTTTVDDALLLALITRNSSSLPIRGITSTESMTMHSEVHGAVVNPFSEQRPLAGATGTRTFTDDEGALRFVAGMVALNPESIADIPVPVITSAVPLSSTSYRVEWEDGGEPE